jgi:hypothetical protein
MTIELVLLAASVVLGIVHIIIVSHLQSWQRGYRWTASSREHSVAPLTGVAGRAERALRNYLETFPFFAAASPTVREWSSIARPVGLVPVSGGTDKRTSGLGALGTW